jgi:hypothetical protein
VHPNLIAALAEDRRKCCPCGAVTDRPNRPRSKCCARVVLRRHTTRPPRSAVRRPTNRQTHARALAVAAARSMLRTVIKGAGS